MLRPPREASRLTTCLGIVGFGSVRLRSGRNGPLWIFSIMSQFMRSPSQLLPTKSLEERCAVAETRLLSHTQVRSAHSYYTYHNPLFLNVKDDSHRAFKTLWQRSLHVPLVHSLGCRCPLQKAALERSLNVASCDANNDNHHPRDDEPTNEMPIPWWDAQERPCHGGVKSMRQKLTSGDRAL